MTIDLLPVRLIPSSLL